MWRRPAHALLFKKEFVLCKKNLLKQCCPTYGRKSGFASWVQHLLEHSVERRQWVRCSDRTSEEHNDIPLTDRDGNMAPCPPHHDTPTGWRCKGGGGWKETEQNLLISDLSIHTPIHYAIIPYIHTFIYPFSLAYLRLGCQNNIIRSCV